MPIIAGLNDAGSQVPIGATEDREAKTADAGSADLLSEILAELRLIRQLAQFIVEESR